MLNDLIMSNLDSQLKYHIAQFKLEKFTTDLEELLKNVDKVNTTKFVMATAHQKKDLIERYKSTHYFLFF